jgi:2-polyprenyl-3-methyl-5-hydroxy-6-metoxy-1,4-benzoquinol methylase
MSLVFARLFGSGFAGLGKKLYDGDSEEAASLVTSFRVLHHIANVRPVLTELGRVVRPGGLLLLREAVQPMGDLSTAASWADQE